MRKDLLVKVAVLGFVALSSCENATGVDGSELVGSWREETIRLSPTGTLERTFSFGSSGEFTWGGQSFGVYTGQPANQLSAYFRIEGSYRVDSGKLILSPRRSVTWDRFYGASSPERVEEVSGNSGYFDNAMYSVRRGVLTLHYTSYPADAPVATTMVLSRL